MADKGQDDRIIVFGTTEFLAHLCSTPNGEVFMDGTFNSFPSIFGQLYTVHFRFAGQTFAAVFALLPDRREQTYVRFLDILKNAARDIGLTFSPRIVLIDFEPAIRTAIASILSKTVIRGCFFHFAQCIWRKVQDLGLVTAYKQNSSLRKTVRRIAALPLMPLNALG